MQVRNKQLILAVTILQVTGESFHVSEGGAFLNHVLSPVFLHFEDQTNSNNNQRNTLYANLSKHVCNVTPHIHLSMAVTLSEQAAHVYGRLSVSGCLSVFLCVHVTMPPPVVQGTEVK